MSILSRFCANTVLLLRAWQTVQTCHQSKLLTNNLCFCMAVCSAGQLNEQLKSTYKHRLIQTDTRTFSLQMLRSWGAFMERLYSRVKHESQTLRFHDDGSHYQLFGTFGCGRTPELAQQALFFISAQKAQQTRRRRSRKPKVTC